MEFPPFHLPDDERIAMATRCRDADCVPKVADAGVVLTDATGQRIQIMHNGLRVIADGYYGKWMTDLIRICRGHHEVQEERLFHEIEKRLPADARMIELGGFWSYYSLWFMKDAPDRHAVVVEPDPVHLEIGKQNAAINGISPTFLPGFAGGSFAPSVAFNTEKSGLLELPRYSVHKLMQQEGIDHLNLLHCDIQGAEAEVLESCRDLFTQGKIDWVFVSTHAHQISGDPLTHQRCLSILRECGAIIEAEHDVHESFSGDGLIVARMCCAPTNWATIELSYNRQSKSLFRHLAYDLAQSQQHVEALRTIIQETDVATPKSLHTSLHPSGSLYTLTSSGPLGAAGDTLLVPDDKVMSPDILENASWAIKDIQSFASHMSELSEYGLVDIGANIGLFTRQLLILSDRVSQCFCVEPDQSNFNALQYNLAGFATNINLFRHALGAANERSIFYRDVENIGNFSLAIDAMRDRRHDMIEVEVQSTSEWMTKHLSDIPHILWKSDTQGFDEMIASLTPWEIWERVDVAMLEMWRIAKPEYDRAAFFDRIEHFPHRRLGDEDNISTAAIEEYLAGDDWGFQNLLLWR